MGVRETGDPEHIAASAVQQIGAAVDACAEAALWSRADSQVEDLVAQAHSLLARVEGTLLLPLIREAERRGLAAAMEAPSTAVWLQWLLRMAPGQAKGLLDLARAVESQVPAVGQALAAGQINHEHARTITTAVAA